ncbi:MAG: ABC transporter permease [bacterium]
MIKHVFRLMWNRKRRSLLLASEILFSYLVLFAVVGVALTGSINYLRPLGFDYENVWLLDVGWRSVAEDLSRDDMTITYQQIQREVEALPEVRKLSWVMGCTPYSMSSWGTEVKDGERTINVRFSRVDDNFAEVMNMELEEGRWFNEEDAVSGRIPVVIDRNLASELSGDGSAVGKILVRGEKNPKELVITGVVKAYRFRGEFNQHGPFLFQQHSWSDTVDWWPQSAMLRVADGVDVQFEQTILKRVAAVARGMDVQIETLTDKRAVVMRDTLLGMLPLIIIAGFLVFNVALGLFGVLWYSINRRRSEIGLRRAIGAEARQVSLQVILEALALATFAIIVGVFLAAQVPILGLKIVTDYVYQDVLAMILAAGLIFLLVTACALYPSRLAARIQPAEALHDE